ncbi:hypothetical protein YC2023_070410 [Brassica napus]
MATPLSFVSPSDESNTVDVDPSIGPIKRGRGRCNGMSYDTGEFDEDGNMIFRGKRKGIYFGFGVTFQCCPCVPAMNKGSKKRVWYGLSEFFSMFPWDVFWDEPEEGMEDQDEFFIEDFDAAPFLAIWFGDADMGVDVTNSKKHATTSPDPKNSGSNLPFASDD